MKTLATLVATCCLALASGTALAQSAMKKDEAMMKDGMNKPMTMQDCKDHMAMAKKDGMKKDDASMKKDDAMMKRDDAMMKKDTMCADMMKKDEAMMKKDGMKK